ncbi:Homeobox protein HD-5 [Astathelohania contejeani]|uniref:Homeobox protein HD-5 n=1 Tax=Astathelohania contejeani TaxID=164912 RepID=A0ABQ7HXK8_9MICR|nr:Homeobox protein HD-5 [Thelohania contejeani]
MFKRKGDIKSINYPFKMRRYNPNPQKPLKIIDSTSEILRSYTKTTETKRKRTKLSEKQIKTLEESFLGNHHPGGEVKDELSSKLGIPVKTVQIWFQNRRAKDKSTMEPDVADEKNYTGDYYHPLYSIPQGYYNQSEIYYHIGSYNGNQNYKPVDDEYDENLYTEEEYNNYMRHRRY